MIIKGQEINKEDIIYRRQARSSIHIWLKDETKLVFDYETEDEATKVYYDLFGEELNG